MVFFSIAPKPNDEPNEARAWKLYEQAEFFSDRCSCSEHAAHKVEGQEKKCNCTVRINPHGPLVAVDNTRPRVDIDNLQVVSTRCYQAHVVELMMKPYKDIYSTGYKAMDFERLLEGYTNGNEYVTLAHIQSRLCRLGHGPNGGLNCFVVNITYNKSNAPTTKNSSKDGYLCHMGKGSVISLAGKDYNPKVDSFLLLRRAILARPTATSTTAPRPEPGYHYIYSSLFQTETNTNAKISTWNHEHPLIQRIVSILIKQKGRANRNDSSQHRSSRGGGQRGRGGASQDRRQRQDRDPKRRKGGHNSRY
jgi:hypothetical protein